MDTYVIATNNAHTLHEIRDILENDRRKFVSMKEAGIATDPEETGSTFEENALIKAEYAAKSGYIALADDSGLVVPALGGAPGIHSARYAGEHGDDAKNRELLLENLKGNPMREAAFLCCIACVLPEGDPIVVHGMAEGEILCFERGEGGFGYDNLFWYDPLGKSFAEMTPEEKNRVSHRRRAVEAFAAALSKRLGIPLKNA